jgi:polyferredoxin
LINTIAGFQEFLVFGVGKDEKKKIEHNQKEEIAKWMFWGLTVLLSFVSYFAELRPLVTNSFGPYYSGMLDGIVVTIIALSTVLYLASKVEKCLKDSGIACISESV